MSEKRKRDDGASVPDYRPGKKKQKKTPQRKGFSVGPQNLPDGVYKRKTQKIKDSLIQKAKIKKDYAKLKKGGHVATQPESLPQPASMQVEREAGPERQSQPEPAPGLEPEASTAPHPDRQTMINDELENPAPAALTQEPPRHEPRRRERKPKPQPFKRENEQALQRKAEAEERRKVREEAERQRQEKMEERERFRKAMAKARAGGPNGQRKLGRESKVLLERVKKMVGEGG